jgi:hypothetical protein
MTELNASESTIRRDLNALDANGQLTKVHGGAILKTMAYSTKDDNVVSRKEKNRDAKNKIAKYAAEQIAPGDFVYLDAGTTTELMIEYITSHQAVFVTNAISHAKRLAERGFTVYLLGGEFKAVTEAIVGEEAVAALENTMNNIIKSGEVMKLKDLISYEEGSIANLDVVSNDTMKFVQKLQERHLINLFLADYVTETLQHNFLLQSHPCGAFYFIGILLRNFL